MDSGFSVNVQLEIFVTFIILMFVCLFFVLFVCLLFVVFVQRIEMSSEDFILK